jgi:hypothetical protein
MDPLSKRISDFSILDFSIYGRPRRLGDAWERRECGFGPKIIERWENVLPPYAIAKG